MLTAQETWSLPSALGLAAVAHLALDAGRYPRFAVTAALVMALVPVGARWFAQRDGRAFRTSVLVLLLVAVPVSSWGSPLRWSVTWPRVAALLWSIGLAVLVATWVPVSWRGRRWDQGSWLTLFLCAGGGFALGLGRIPPNELAGILAVFVPVAGALALAGPAGREAGGPPWALAIGALLVLSGVLVAIGSRGGLAAAVCGLGTVAVATGPRGWRALAVGSGAVVLVGLVMGPQRLSSFWIFDQSPQGWSWWVVLSGRPEIWDRAQHILADAGWTGIGLGNFGAVAARLYPMRLGDSVFEDAHNFLLQTALDVGVVGLLAIVGLLAATLIHLLRAVRRWPLATPQRWRAAGLLGGLVAFLVHGVFDAVALGVVGGVALWWLLGLVFATPVSADTTASQRSPTTGRRRWRPVAAVLTLVALGSVAVLPAARSTIELNLAALQAMRAVLAAPDDLPAAHAALARLRPEPCRARWLEGVVLATQNDARRTAAWQDAMRCDPRLVDLVSVAAAQDRPLARAAMAIRPADPRGYRWLADSFGVQPSAANLPAALDAYRTVARLEPENGWVWHRIGRLTINDDPAAALEAFRSACRYGDPGANSCVHAGELAHFLGDDGLAVQLLRQSRWPPAHRRAAELAAGATRAPAAADTLDP